ncbi:MAG: excinuclease ABC subunit UvrC [Candidatus Melainabacteria bacterium]|nr:excinuclease ABC subunit UvrC [Candidatus Melainabacteria bacterium]
MTKTNIKSELSNLSKSPGIYIFRDAKDKIIYIGKAINLKSRVRSYWNESSWADRPKLAVMVPKIKRLETIVTKSEKEALILESNLVFKHQPKYNALLKANNKYYPWLVITYDEAYPRLIPVRDIEQFKSKQRTRGSRNKFFGPYTNISAMYENLNLVNELFPLRKKRVPPFKNRPCLNYDLGKCLGPCQQLISEEDYAAMLKQVELLLKGDFSDLQAILKQEMQRYSDNLEYEKAAKARDRIKALETFNETQNVISDDKNLDQDVFALVRDEDTAYLQVFKTRAGRLINRDSLDIDCAMQDPDPELYESALLQYYSQVPDEELPRELVINIEIESPDAFADWLTERKGSKVKIIKPQRGDKFALLKLAERNARLIMDKTKLEQMEDASKDINTALANLERELDLRTQPQRVECFDISHIQGTNVVASMVCFIDGLPDKNEYRRFKLSVDQNDDFESMREVVSRRYKSKEALPNLIIIDGGKGQVNAAYEVMKGLELDYIKMVGLAKRDEELYLPGESRPIVLDRKSPELFFVQRIRNEAHRFAVAYHRRLRSKRSLASVLDSIPGLGPKKRVLLLDKFGSLGKIKDASLEDLASLPGITEALAKKIQAAI